jgi:hypothetical protein
MCEEKINQLKSLLVMATMTFSLSGCMTTNPATGQQQVDYGATAGVAGAAMGAAALGVALSNNNNDRIVYGGPGWGGGGYRGGHNTVNVNNSRNARVNRNANLNNRPNRGMNQRNVARNGNRSVNRGGNRGGGRRR